MSERSVLYDEPGPRTRRITLILSIVATILIIAGIYFFVFLPMDEYGQFSAKKWDPLINPSDENFPLVWKRIGEGLQATVIAAVLAIIASLLFGSALAVARLQLQSARQLHYVNQSRPVALVLRVVTVALNAITRVFVEFFRGLPVVITIYFVARALPEFGVDFDTLWYLVIGLALYNSVVIAEILRSGMSGLPGGQREAASALGLSSFKTIRLILLPQSFRIMLPALISQIVVIFKDTSLATLISYEDLLAVGIQIFNFLNNPIQVLTVIAVIYIVINYALSKLAEYLQRRIARGRRSPGPAPALPPSTMAVGETAGASA
jgi:glutamate transport system permease protein